MFSGGREPLLIQDTREHPLTCEMPVTFSANVGSYLGVPVFYQNGDFYGTLCAVDSKPSNFSAEHIKTLENLSHLFTYVLELEERATKDLLTGLFNRYYLYKLFDEEISASDTSKGTIMFLDLDGFKKVNDKYGHELGDIVLKEVGDRIKKCLTEQDIGVRLGGDEFIIVFQGLIERTAVEQKAKELLKIMADWNIYGQRLPLSTSIGITLYPNDEKHIRTLLKYADTAMYKAKERGKNNFQFF